MKLTEYKSLPAVLLLLAIGLGVSLLISRSKADPRPQRMASDASGGTMKIFSPAFGLGEPILSEFTCEGRDVNPPLIFEEVPEGTQSFALVMDDPDAPSGTWTHWVVWNLSPETRSIASGARLVNGQEGVTSAKKIGYHGPCPPDGTHRYYFRLYALSSILDLAQNATAREVELAAQEHVIARAEYFGTYSRRQ